MSRNIPIVKFDLEAEGGVGSFSLDELRCALKEIGDPYYKEWGIEEGADSGGIETGEVGVVTEPDGTTYKSLSTDEFHLSVEREQITSLSWHRPCGRIGTIQALWMLVEAHQLVLMDESCDDENPMIYAPSEAMLCRLEKAFPDYEAHGVCVLRGFEGFRAFIEAREQPV